MTIKQDLKGTWLYWEV